MKRIYVWEPWFFLFFGLFHSKAVDTPSIIRQDLGGEEMARILLHYDI